jgi:hypothetical protein
MNAPAGLSRRDLIKGGALIVGFKPETYAAAFR